MGNDMEGQGERKGMQGDGNGTDGEMGEGARGV